MEVSNDIIRMGVLQQAENTFAGIKAVKEEADEGRTEKAANMMESLFATYLVKEMRKSVPEGFFGKGTGSDIFEGWLDKHVGEVLAKENALGIAGMIKAGLPQAESEAE